MSIPRFQHFPEIKWVTQFGNRPSLSPDGTKIVFQRDMADGSSLWTVHVDGSNLERLYPLEGTSNATRPDWSWSHKIAFSKDGVIWTIDPDTKHAEAYYKGPETLDGNMEYPSWYRDLKAIAAVRYYRDVHGAQQAEIYKITPTALERLTTSPHPVAGRPSVSPDGTKIAFAGNEGVYSQERNQIWIVETATKRVYRLEPGNDAEFQGRSPNWSPRGDLIVFESTRPADPPTTSSMLAAFVIHNAGAALNQITLYGISHPEWSRDQSRIVFDAREGIGIIHYPPPD